MVSRCLRTAWLPLCVLGVAGCVSYEPKPLDLEAFGDAWQAGESAQEPGAETDESRPDAWDLARAEAAVLTRHRTLLALRQGLLTAAARAEFAGLVPDPQLSLSFLSVLEGGSDPRVFAAGLAWAWPFARLRDARVERAHASVRAQEHSLSAAELDALGDLGIAWAGFVAARQLAALERRFSTEFDRLAASLEALADSGEASALDAGLARLEATRMRARTQRAEADVVQRAFDLRRVLALPPSDTTVQFVADAAATRRAAREAGPVTTHPRVLAAQARYEVAEQTLRREVAKQFPGISVGPRYENEEGQDRLGGGISLPLPLWNRNRGAIAVATAQRESARIAAETTWIEVVQSRAQQAAELANANAILETLETDVAPEIAEQIENARRLITAGEASTALLLDTLRQARMTARLEITTQLRADIAVADLHRWWSPEAPTSSETTDR